MIINEPTNKLLKLKNELLDIANLNDLHPICVQNLFYKAISISYELPFENWLVNLNRTYQVVFYNMFDKEIKVFNLSKKMLSEIVKTLNKLVTASSENNMNNIFSVLVDSKDVIELNPIYKSRKYVKFSLVHGQETSHIKLSFTHRIKTKEQLAYIESTNNFFIVFSDIMKEDITKKIAAGQKKIEIEIDLFNHSTSKIFIEGLIKNVEEKSNGKFKFKLKNINHKNNIAFIKCNTFLPKQFIQYLDSVVYHNTLLNISFIK